LLQPVDSYSKLSLRLAAKRGLIHFVRRRRTSRPIGGPITLLKHVCGNGFNAR
jgi:hypothetical protein